MTETPIFLAPIEGQGLLTSLLAPFFPRYRVLKQLQTEPAHLRGSYRNLILSHDKRLLFMRNQKCACTQTTQFLYAYGNQGKTYKGNVHRADRGIYPARYRWSVIKPVLAKQDAFLFTFVRDPVTRATSAFRNFFLDHDNIARHKHLGPMHAHGFDPLKAADYNFDVFLDYITHTFDVDALRCDTHWRLQIHNIAFADLRYDLIGRVESYNTDIARVFAAVERPDFPPATLLAQRHNPSRPTDFVPSAAQRARIVQTYAADYQAFGY
jgi:Sulfotransferase family